ncbi:hypothetical protein EAG_14278 [Camponotus floridanus]|uniref:Uncharacterized protein n=1 Tax=Camponotus floridanus TaxID=104421 RepID=E2A4E8_CAMFO|nr:hypothetical protein EAG_14278 [Camponotus floridanus]
MFMFGHDDRSAPKNWKENQAASGEVFNLIRRDIPRISRRLVLKQICALLYDGTHTSTLRQTQRHEYRRKGRWFERSRRIGWHPEEENVVTAALAVAVSSGISNFSDRECIKIVFNY